MTDNIQKLYEIAGVDYEDRYCNCTLNKELECDPKCSCDICEHAEDKYNYPLFTAEKQLELIKWLTVNFEECKLCYEEDYKWYCQTYANSSYCYEKPEDALAGLIFSLWEDLTDTQKMEIKEILK